jgi:hypothetical protein
MTPTDPQPLPSPSGRPGLIRRTLRRHWIGILAASLLVDLVAGFLVFQNVGPTYKALSLLRVDPTMADLFGVKPGGESFEAFLQTQVQLITSPNVLTAAGTNPKVAVLQRVHKAGDVVQELRGAVNVSVIPGTYLIEVSMTSKSGYESATIVNGVVDAFMEANSEWSDGMTRLQIKNLEQYYVDLKNQTDELERKWKALAARGDLDIDPSVDGDPNGPGVRVTISLEEYRAIRRQLNEVSIELAQAQAWLTTAKQAVTKAGEAPGPAVEKDLIDQQMKRRFQLDPEAVALVAKIRQAEEKYNEAQRIAPRAEDAAVIRAKRKLEALNEQWQTLWDSKQEIYRQQIEGGDGKPLDPVREIGDATTAVAKLQARQVSLKSEFAKLDVKTKTRATDAVEIELIRDQRETLKGMQDAVIRRLEQLRYEAKGEARIRPVNPNGAMVPNRPISDRRPQFLAILPFATLALAFGFFVGVEACSAPKAEADPAKPEGDMPAGE